MFAQVTIVAIFAGLAAAQHAPTTMGGNPITRPLNEIVPACKAFTITWQPTTPNSVSLILLRGPAENVVPLGAPIVTGISNSGSYMWTPSASLEADTTHYGLQLIDDITGQYQYSTQFGISKGAACNVVVSSSAAASSSMGYGYGYSASAASSTAHASSTKASSAKASSTAMAYPASSAVSKINSTTIVTKTSTPVVASTGAPANSSIIQPTKPLTVPSSLYASATGSPSATKSALPESTGAASSIKTGLGFVGAAAAFAFML